VTSATGTEGKGYQPAGPQRRALRRVTGVMARASRVPLGRMRGDPDVSRESSASHQNGSRRTPLRGSRSSAPLVRNESNMKPITSQVNLTNMTSIQKFMMWFPFIGTDVRVVKDVTSQLKLRPEFPSGEWKEFKNLDDIIEFSKRLAKANEWPNHYFHPRDPIDLLFFPTDGDGWDVIKLAREWERRTNKEFPFRKNVLYGELFAL
jgi:hypothetical protein